MIQYIVTISKELVRILHVQSFESHPLEVSGVLLGHDNGNLLDIRYILVNTVYKIRTRTSVQALYDLEDYWEETSPLDVIGEWHSHPNSSPILSRNCDLSDWEKRHNPGSDENTMKEGALEWIVGVFPTKRKRFQFKDRCYLKIGPKIRVCKIRVY